MGSPNLSSVATELVPSRGTSPTFFVPVPIYIFLFLLYRGKTSRVLWSWTRNGEMHWKKEVESVIRGYMPDLSIVVFIAGALNSIGLLILGIDHAIFFGFLSGCLIRLFHTWALTVGATLPGGTCTHNKKTVFGMLWVLGVHAFVQFLEGNFITPKITGSRISINAMAAILALLIGGKIWGIPAWSWRCPPSA